MTDAGQEPASNGAVVDRDVRRDGGRPAGRDPRGPVRPGERRDGRRALPGRVRRRPAARTRLVRRPDVHHLPGRGQLRRRLHRLSLGAGHDDARGLIGPEAPLRADGGRLRAVLPQALGGLGLDRAALPPPPDPAPDDRERAVPRPGREPPDGLHRAAGGPAPRRGPGHREPRRAPRPDPGAPARGLQRHLLRQRGAALHRRRLALRRGAVSPEYPRPRSGPTQRGRRRPRLVRRGARRRSLRRGPPLDRLRGDAVQPDPGRRPTSAPACCPASRRCGSTSWSSGRGAR